MPCMVTGSGPTPGRLPEGSPQTSLAGTRISPSPAATKSGGGWSRSQKEWEDYKGEDESEDEDGDSLLGDASFEAEMSNRG